MQVMFQESGLPFLVKPEVAALEVQGQQKRGVVARFFQGYLRMSGGMQYHLKASGTPLCLHNTFSLAAPVPGRCINVAIVRPRAWQSYLSQNGKPWAQRGETKAGVPQRAISLCSVLLHKVLMSKLSSLNSKWTLTMLPGETSLCSTLRACMPTSACSREWYESAEGSPTMVTIAGGLVLLALQCWESSAALCSILRFLTLRDLQP